MKFEVLVSTMNRTNHDLLDEMNIRSGAVVINQCDRNEFDKLDYKGNSIKFLSFAERGVGLSRNTALIHAKSDICLFADDDVVYENGYQEIIMEAFEQNPKADMIMFNVPSRNAGRPGYTIRKHGRVRWFNCLRYPTYKIAIRTSAQKKSNTYFSLHFGGGAEYSHGEDSLFISDFIKKGLKVYASPAIIGHVDHNESTWFEGFTDEYFIDKGALYYCMSKRWSKLLCLQFVLRHYKMFQKDKTIVDAFKLMIEGAKEYRK